MSEQRMTDLLGGLRILDLTDERGHLCGKVLGDYGADVVKIEPPGGDPARNRGPFYKDMPHPERSLYWFFANLNKRGITLNLETPDGREIFKRLVKAAHFVIESYEPGYMASLGLGYVELEKINPAIIMTSITPFGQTGPYAHYRVTDIVLQAMGNLVYLYGDPDRPPVRISQPQAYFLGGLQGSLGSIMAHYHREMTGEGQYVDVSIQDAVILTLMTSPEYWDILHGHIRSQGAFSATPRGGGLPPLRTRAIWPCKDGYVFGGVSGGAQAGYVHSVRELVKFANEHGFAKELADYNWPLYDDMKITQEERERLEQPFFDFYATKTKAELFERAVERSILLIPANTIKDVVESPQLAFREFWVQVEHAELGQTITYPGFPIKMGELRYRPQRRAPLIGEHNEEIYETLGFSKEQLVILRANGVI